MSADDYPGRGALPDALAFLNPNRTECYLTLERADDPLTAAELAAALDCSSATVYRMLNDLQDCGIITEAVRLEEDCSPKTAYTTASVEATEVPTRARTDGGIDR